MISGLGPGGAERAATQVLKHWLDQGQRVALITFAGEDSDFFLPDPRCRRVVLGDFGEAPTRIHGIVANLRRIRKLRRVFQVLGPRTIVSFTGTTNILTVISSRFTGRRVVVSERNDPMRQRLGFPWDLLRRWLYGRADVVTAISKGSAEAMSAFVPRSRLRVVPLLTSLPDVTGTRADIPGPAILSVGRLERQKGQDLLLRAFSRTRDRFPQWHLVLVGEGSQMGELKSLAEELMVADFVTFGGRTDNPYAYYRASDIFAFPSRHEGLGNALLEAMSCGLPVIISDASPGPLEVVTDGEEGLIARAENHIDLANALQRLMADPTLRTRLGDASRRRFEQYATQAEAAWDGILDH